MIITAAVVVPTVLFSGGRALFTDTMLFLDWGAGVLALVSLTAAVLWGIAATDRLFLQPVHRLVAQGVHRVAAVSGLGFLLVHIWVKVTGTTADADPAASVIPFADGQRPVLIGLGTIASYGFVGVAATGALRSSFTSIKRARLWRVLHCCVYPAWGAALVHGLRAGRLAAGWVTASYALCLLGMAAALIVRMKTRPPNSKQAAAAAATAAASAAATAAAAAAALPRGARPAVPLPRLERPRQAPAGLLPPQIQNPGLLGGSAAVPGSMPQPTGGFLPFDEQPTQIAGGLGGAGLPQAAGGYPGQTSGGFTGFTGFDEDPAQFGGDLLGSAPAGTGGFLGFDQEPTQVMGAVPPGDGFGQDPTQVIDPVPPAPSGWYGQGDHRGWTQ